MAVSNRAYEPQQRLHPSSCLFGAITFIRHFIIPFIVAAIYGSRQNMSLWLALGALAPILASLWHQWFFRYGFGPDGLVVRSGLVFRNTRQIDYARIENIDTERGVLHRLLGVAEVRVESSRGGRPEAVIQVISLAAAEELRRYVFARRHAADAEQGGAADGAGVPDSEASETLLHLPIIEVVKFGLIDNRGMIVVAAILGAVYQLGMIEVQRALLEQFQFEYVEAVLAAGLIAQVLVMSVVLIAAFILLRVLSVAFALLTLFDFRLARVGADLRITHGLLTRVTLTLRLARIQAVHQTQTVLHRLFNRVCIRVDLAGDSAPQGQSEAEQKVRWLAPLTDPHRARELIQLALPHIQMQAELQWQRLAAGARRRVFRRNLAWWAVISVAVAALLREPSAGFMIVVGVPIAWVSATLYVKHTQWALADDFLAFRSGWLTRKLIIVPRDRIQTAHCSQSPFDRRHAMASVSVDTAGSGARSDTVRIPYLDFEVAQQLARALFLSAARDRAAALENSEPLST